MSKKWDIGGICISAGCLLHCVILPYAFTGISIVGVNILTNAYVEACLVCAAAVVGWLSIYKARKMYKKRRGWVGIVFWLGIAVLISRIFFHEYDIALSVIALSCIIAAHSCNVYFSHKSSS